MNILYYAGNQLYISLVPVPYLLLILRPLATLHFLEELAALSMLKQLNVNL